MQVLSNNRNMISQKKKNVWILADNRVGSVNQAIALAQQMGFNYELKPVEYNSWAKLPNCLLALYPLHIKKGLRDLQRISNFPDIIISSGRRTASLSSYLRRKSGNKIKIIQIMHPNLPFKQFAVVILPKHDKVIKNAFNIIRVTGALNNVQAKMLIEGPKLRINYPKLGRFIAVIIGGNSKNFNFTSENAIEFAEILSHIAMSQQYNLFVSFSRRTPAATKQIIKNNIPSSSVIYDPLDEETKVNPYLGMLAEADYIISTVDSISICSEAAATGTPLYVICPKNFKSRKHLSFLQQLLKLGIAKMLDKSTTHLVPYKYTPLSEVERISSEISKFC